MTPDGRVRISLSTGELEIEGSSEFVASYDGAIKDMLERLANERVPAASMSGAQTGSAANESQVGGVSHQGAGPRSDRREFGEVLHELPNNATGTDQILVAAWYAGGDEPVGTGDAHKLLIEQGVKLSNAAQCMRQNANAKRVFKSGNKWRISKSGKDYLKSLKVL